jgi:2-C-methyl-D-erythritol 4-phosphate cytidylyltransferase
LVDIQTPQVFDVDLIKGALTNVKNKNLAVTDDCMAVELLGVNVHITTGSASNIKITNLDDIIIAQTILSQNADNAN